VGPVSAAGSFDVLDGDVRGFGLGVGCSGADERGDGWGTVIRTQDRRNTKGDPARVALSDY
jgi:hypothetical protein